MSREVSRWMLWVGAGLVLALSGCEYFQDEPEVLPPDKPVVTVPRFAEAPFIIPLGEPLTLTAYVNNPDGSPATGYEFYWNGWDPNGGEVKAEFGHPAPGVETVTLTFLREIRLDVSVTVTVVNAVGAAVARVRPERVVAWGGTTREVLPFQQEVALRVGEARPTAALPHGQRNPAEPNVRILGKEPLGYATANPAIATVDATGVVRGVAPGQTTLTFQSPTGATASIPVRVQTGALEPAAEGAWPADGVGPSAIRSDYGARLLAGKVAVDDQLAVDSQGRAFAVLTGGARTATLASLTIHSVLLSRWTGSGLGVEWVSQPWDAAEDPRLVLDARDVPYVTYTSRHFGDIVVADRPAEGAPDTWRHRRLPMDLGLAADAGLRPPQYVGRHELSHVAMLPREGGGVWIAWWMADRFDDQNPTYQTTEFLETPARCAEVIKLAEVTDDAVKTQEVLVRWNGPPLASTCDAYALASTRTDMPLQLLPPAPGERLPRVLSTHDKPLTLHESQGGTWTARQLAHPVILSTGFDGPNFVTLARPETPDGPTVLLSYDKLTGALPADLTFNALPGQEPVPYFSFEGGDTARQTLYFGFQSEGRMFSGSGFVGPLVARTGLGGFFKDEPTGPWVAPTRAYSRQWSQDFPMRGHAHRGARLHLLSETSRGVPQLLSRGLPPAEPLSTAPETRGARLGTTPVTARVSTAPIVLADGARYLLTDLVDSTVPGGVLRSEGPGQPFVPRRARIGGEALFSARRLWHSGGGLFLLEEQGSALRVHRSADQGASFSAVSTTPRPAAPVEAAWVHAEGSGPLFVMFFDKLQSFDFQWGFSPNAATTPPTILPGFTAAERGRLVVLHGALLPTSTGVLLAVDALKNDGTGSHAQLLLRQYDLTGTLVSERTVDPLLRPGIYLRAEGAALAGDDTLVWVTDRDVRRVDLTTGAVTHADLPARNMQEPVLAPVRLADGRLLLPVTERVRPHVHHAGYRLSADGLTWGPFQALRPTGADGQAVLSVAAEPDGGALFVLGDSGLMMAGDGEVVTQAIVQRVFPVP